MIKKRSTSNGIQANISLEPTSASQSTSNINNNIIINKRDDKTEEVVITRNIEPEQEFSFEEETDVKLIILDTYAKILLNQDKALLSNLISKNCIIVPATSLTEIIKTIVNAETVEININEDVGCLAKSNPIKKIESIKIVNDNGEICTDFKQVYNKEYNELTSKYHLCLKYCINM